MNRKDTIHSKIYFYLLLLLAASLPLSIFASSVFQFALVLNWILEGQFREKWNRLRSNRAFWVYTLVLFVHLAGMLWSSEIHYGLHDLKVKLPIVFLPLLVVSSPALIPQQVRKILTAFIAACMVGSFASVLALLNVIPADMSDYRNASLFISHIRFSLMIVLSIFFAAYMLFHKSPGEQRYLKILFIFTLAWFPVFLVILRSLSGMVISGLVFFVVSLLLVKNVRDRAGRFMIMVFIITVPLFAVIYIGNAINRFYTFEEIEPAELDSLTVEGNPYMHLPDKMETENGNFVWINIAPEELEREWDRVSEIPYMGEAENGEPIRFTLIRYLTSKGLRKDAAGVRRLESVDIEAIESGIANHIYLNRFALYPRIYEVIWEFERYSLGYSPNNKSLVQRWYYLKAGIHIASENLLYGVGTGDVRQSFIKYYEKNDSPLRLERRRRAHNQYLTLLIAFGIPGMLLCLAALVLPVFMRHRQKSYMVVVFMLTMAFSMLDEDTLETTPGAVMFGLFYALFVFGADWKWRGSRKQG